MFTFGYFNLNPFKAFVVNTFLAITDLIFYWILVGSGTFFVLMFFPEFDLPALFESPKFSNFLLISTFIAYFAYFAYRLYRWKREQKKNSL